jgi:hypothetical protein
MLGTYLAVTLGFESLETPIPLASSLLTALSEPLLYLLMQ